MKRPLALVLIPLFYFLLIQATQQPSPLPGNSRKIARSSEGTNQSLVMPGLGVGPLKLGDSYERAKQLFPRKENMDQEFDGEGECGTEYNWVDLKNKTVGNVFVRVKNGSVYQIDASTARYRTDKGITVNSPPEAVKKHYKGLRAFVLSNGTSEAIGGEPLIYWVNNDKGIAFAFAYGKSVRRWTVWGIIIFKPNTAICPLYPPLESTDKRELEPYSLKPFSALRNARP